MSYYGESSGTHNGAFQFPNFSLGHNVGNEQHHDADQVDGGEHGEHALLTNAGFIPFEGMSFQDFFAHQQRNFMFLSLMANTVAVERPMGVPYNTSILTGKMYVEEILNSSPNKFKDTLRMPKQAFTRLCGCLRDSRLLVDSGQSKVHIEEAVMIWMNIAIGNHTQRTAEDRFQHSLETINRQFRRVTDALCHLGRHIIRPYKNNPHDSIVYNNKFNPFFHGCIGAIDGTFIKSIMQKEVHQACRHRKGEIGHTLLAVVDHDLLITWGFSGFEASGHDGGVFKHVTNPMYRFPVPPPGCFYVADSAFPNLKEVWNPFTGKNYQRSDFVGNPPKNEFEMYNYRHAQIRNVVERAFGILKNRFKILKQMGHYEPHFQARIVIVCLCMHNFIRLYGGKDRDYFPDEISEHEAGPEGPPNANDYIDQSDEAVEEAYEARYQVARDIWGDAIYHGWTH